MRAAAPDAVQVADRFHLVAHIRAALANGEPEGAVMRHAADVRATAQVRAGVRDAGAAERRAARLALYVEAVALRDAGTSHGEIRERLNLGRGTVRSA